MPPPALRLGAQSVRELATGAAGPDRFGPRWRRGLLNLRRWSPRFPRAPQHHDAQAWAPGTARCLAVCTPSPHCLFLAPILPGLASMPGGPSSPLHCQGPGPLPWVTSALYKTGTNSRPRTTLVVHSGYFVYGFILSSATEEVF